MIPAHLTKNPYIKYSISPQKERVRILSLLKNLWFSYKHQKQTRKQKQKILSQIKDNQNRLNLLDQRIREGAKAQDTVKVVPTAPQP